MSAQDTQQFKILVGLMATAYVFDKLTALTSFTFPKTKHFSVTFLQNRVIKSRCIT